MPSNFHREITTLTPEDSFLVFDRIKEDVDFPIHFHPEFELNFILNGKAVRRIVGDSMEEIEEIELVLVGPNLQHGWEIYKCRNKDIREITIQFHNDLFNKRLLARRIMKPIKDMFHQSSHGILFSKKVAEEVKEKILKLSKIESLDSFLELIAILQILATSRNQRLLSSNTYNNKTFGNEDNLRLIYKYVQENYHNKISLNEISKEVNMSPVSFNRFIKRRTGKTFIEYVNDTRIGYAARWLIERDLSIAEVAFKCGFNNIANFNRVFKKNKNCTPSEYREEFNGIKRVL